MSEHIGYYNDHTEIYVLENLRWRFPTDGGFFQFVSNRTMKLMDERASAPVGSVPVVREICPRCGGYGGDQMDDGWMSCYHCCEVGFIHTPLDMYLMEQLHLDAYEHDYQRGMRIEQSKRSVLAGLHSIGQSLNVLFNPPQQEVEDDIPF